jgi:hypothetical protein
LAIECKFTEPYGPKRRHPEIAKKYFANGVKRWTDVGLPRCQVLAAAIGRDVAFTRLGTGQLLKHLLGLAFTTKLKPRLLCLWYDTGCSEAKEHREELDRFGTAIGDEVEFSVRSYQEVYRRLKGSPEPVPGYLSYLEDRYFVG